MQLEAASRPAGLAPSKAATGATSPPSNMKNLQRHQQQQQRQLRVASGVPAESSGTAVQEQQQQQEDSEGEEEDNYEEEEEDEDEEEYEEGFFMTFYTEKRHLEPVRLFHQGPPLLLLLPASFKGQQPPASSASSSIPLSAFSNLQQMAPIQWRMREKLKTVSVALVLCLNIGIDPPDVMKPNPCAKLECWQDPFSQPPQKALENIGRALQLQYEVWQPRAKYRLSLDPSIDDTKKLCCSLRKSARDERVLFHYNGHGVPKPTQGGELWVFNKTYTQYIPVSIYDIQTWLGSPCIYVYDCSNAGNILIAFNRFAVQRDAEASTAAAAAAISSGGVNPATHSASNSSVSSARQSTSSPPPPPTQLQQQHLSSSSSSSASNSQPSTQPNAPEDSPVYTPMQECIQLAACGPTESLPLHPDLPADMFTASLTTPIEIALRWFIAHDPLLKTDQVRPEMVARIPGRLNDRRTPLGELNWIFTSITDTIAWNVLPNDLFKKYFRQDLMVAALFRNFLLAARIMRYYGCHPMSSPSLPPTHEHPMWQAWDLAAESCLSQLPALLAAEDGTGPAFEYRHSTFFAEQLTAFEVWLRKGPISKTPPQQLPIVLQVLLSQIHRLRALMLLSRFLDLGPWAVNLALSVGIFPYVLKLLQSPAQELKLVLVFIWAKILAVDRACQTDLLKDNGYTYFISILSSSTSTAASTTLTSSSSNPATTSSQQQSSSNSSSSIPNISEHRAMCVFILAVFCKGFRAGQEACLKTDLLAALAMHLTDPDPLLRQWVCLCYAACWDGYPDAKWTAMRESVHERLVHLTTLDPAPEVRCAALRALATLFGQLDKTEQIVKVEHDISMSVEIARNDASPLVRRELVHVFFRVIREYFPKFVAAAFEVWEDDRRKRGMMGGSSGGGGTTLSLGHSASSKLLGISTADDKRSRRSTIHGASEDIKQIVNSKSVSSSSNLSSSVSPAKNSLVSASPSSATTTTLSDNFDSSSPMARSAKFIVGANNGGTSSSLMLKKSLDSLTAASTTSKTVTTTTTDGLGAASSSSNSIYGCVYNALLTLSVDPMPEVAFLACKVVDSINTKMRATLIDPAMIASSPQPLSASSSKDLQQNQNHHQQSLRNVNTTTASSTLSAEDRRLTGSPGHTSPHFTTLPTNRSTIIGSSANNNSTATSSTALRKSASFAYSLRNLTGFWGSNGALSSSGTAQTSSNSQSTATVTATTSSGGTTSTTSGTRANSPKRDAGVSSSHHNPALPTSPAMMANQSFPLFAGGNGMAPLELNASSRSSFNGSQDSSGNGRASIIQQPSHSQQQISAAIGEIDMEDSGFFEWSCEYFAEPQMRVAESEDPGSVKFTERQWRRHRNDKVIERTLPTYPLGPSAKFEDIAISFDTDGHPPTNILFHQFESNVAMCNEKDNVISIYNWRDGNKVSCFLNGNQPMSRITSLKFINEDDQALLVSASDDGIIRMHKGYDSAYPELITAWTAMADLLPTGGYSGPVQTRFAATRGRNTGLVMDWQQSVGCLILSGCITQIKVWDAEREVCAQDIPTASAFGSTALTSEKYAGHLLVSGFSDGVVRVYDRRAALSNCLIHTMMEHKSPIIKVHLQQGGEQELYTASMNGEVRIWDLRKLVTPVKSLVNHDMTCFDVHDNTSLFACGTAAQTFEVYDSATMRIKSVLRHQDPLMGSGRHVPLQQHQHHNQQPLVCLAFHPTELVAATCALNSTSITVFASELWDNKCI